MMGPPQGTSKRGRYLSHIESFVILFVQVQTRSRYLENFLDSCTSTPPRKPFFVLFGSSCYFASTHQKPDNKTQRERKGKCFSGEVSRFSVSAMYLGFRPILLVTFFQSIPRVPMEYRYVGYTFPLPHHSKIPHCLIPNEQHFLTFYSGLPTWRAMR